LKLLEGTEKGPNNNRLLTYQTPDKTPAPKGGHDTNNMVTPTVSSFVDSVIIRPIVVAINSLVLASLMSYVMAERLDWRPVSPLFVNSRPYSFLTD